MVNLTHQTLLDGKTIATNNQEFSKVASAKHHINTFINGLCGLKLTTVERRNRNKIQTYNLTDSNGHVVSYQFTIATK